MAVNILVDPGNVMGIGEEERRIAEELLAGRSVRVTTVDELLVQRRYAEGTTRRLDVLIVGSSRSMPLSGRCFPGQRVFNASVSSGSLENYLALIQLWEERGLRPRKIVLALDPWVLSAPLRNRSGALDAELQRGIERLKLGTGPTRGTLPPARSARTRYLQLVSPAYFQAALSTLVMGGRGRPFAERLGRGVPAPDAAGNLVAPDGSVEWAPSLAGRTAQDARRDARASAARPPPYLTASRLEPERQRLLQALVARLRSEGVSLVFWLAPLHPDAYQTLRSSGRAPVLEAAELYCRSLAEAQGVALLGSFDPAVAGASELDFIDQHHLRYAAVQRLFSKHAQAAGLPWAGAR